MAIRITSPIIRPVNLLDVLHWEVPSKLGKHFIEGISFEYYFAITLSQVSTVVLKKVNDSPYYERTDSVGTFWALLDFMGLIDFSPIEIEDIIDTKKGEIKREYIEKYKINTELSWIDFKDISLHAIFGWFNKLIEYGQFTPEGIEKYYFELLKAQKSQLILNTN